MAGETAICYWLAMEAGGDIQYNWEDDGKAGERWDKRTERILEACVPVMARAPSTLKRAGKWKRGLVVFPHCNFIQQGSFTSSNLDSDTIRFQVNEEVHNWKVGRLDKAYKRITAVWNASVFNISNASKVGDQLHRAFKNGTQEPWEVPCPTCGIFHALHTRWDPKKPELGGLRYDAEGCRLEDGRYDYAKLGPTVHYQFPCGHTAEDRASVRRGMSQRGRYGAPRNPDAKPGSRSFILEAASVDYIPWVDLIAEKHAAMAAARNGDPEPWWQYLKERECTFVDEMAHRPPSNTAVRVTVGRRKSREGMPNRVVRVAAIDRQQGSLRKGGLPHWWMVIRDSDAVANTELVYEGRIDMDNDVVDIVKTHDVKPWNVVVDTGDDTLHSYRFCLRHGYNAIKGRGEATFSHKDGSRRIFSEERPLHVMLSAPRSRPNSPAEEPLFWLYSKQGIRERLQWMRTNRHFGVPEDVSPDYLSHMESEELQDRRLKGELITEWVQVRERNDLLVCEAYVAMMLDMAGLFAPVDAGAAGDPEAELAAAGQSEH